MVKMSTSNCDQAQVDLSSSDFSVISHPAEDSLANGLQFLQLPAPVQLPLDDFRSQLQELLQENAELKGALQQNTSIMRHHFKTLSDWQEKVGMANQRHRRMLEDSSKLLLQTRQENQMLRSQVQELEVVLQTKENEQAIKETKEYMQLQKAEEPRNSPLLYVDDDDAGYTVVHHLPDADEKSCDLRAKLHEEHSCSVILMQKLAEEQLKSARLQQQLNEAALLKSHLDQVSSFLQHYNDRCSSMDQRLSEHQGRIDILVGSGDARLREEISMMRALLTQEQTCRESDRQSLQSVTEKLEKVFQDQVPLGKWKNSQCEGRQVEALRAIEKRQQQEHSDSLTAQLVGTAEELNACRRELEQLKSQVELLRHDSEQVPILRAQVEIYQQDFEGERQSKERMQVELEKARSNISSLNLQNQQLMDELSAVQLPSTERHHRRSRHQSPIASRDLNPTARRVSDIEHLEPCPRCQLIFSNMEALQNHIEQCLDAEFSPYP